MTTCTINATFHDAAGDPLDGVVTFTPAAVLVGSESLIVHDFPITCLVTDGVLKHGENTGVTLQATDDESYQPVGWTYRVYEDFGEHARRAYSILAPTGSYDLSALPHVPDSVGEFIVAPPT